MGEDRPSLELESTGLGVVNADADDVRGQQVRGELDPGEGQFEAAGQGSGQHGLAHARGVLNQQVPAAYQPYQDLSDGVRLAQEDPINVLPQLGQPGQQGIIADTNVFGHGWRPLKSKAFTPMIVSSTAL